MLVACSNWPFCAVLGFKVEITDEKEPELLHFFSKKLWAFDVGKIETAHELCSRKVFCARLAELQSHILKIMFVTARLQVCRSLRFQLRIEDGDTLRELTVSFFNRIRCYKHSIAAQEKSAPHQLVKTSCSTKMFATFENIYFSDLPVKSLPKFTKTLKLSCSQMPEN